MPWPGRTVAGVSAGSFGRQVSEIAVGLLGIKGHPAKLIDDGVLDAGQETKEILVPVELHEVADAVSCFELGDARPGIVMLNGSQRLPDKTSKVHHAGIVAQQPSGRHQAWWRGLPTRLGEGEPSPALHYRD